MLRSHASSTVSASLPAPSRWRSVSRCTNLLAALSEDEPDASHVEALLEQVNSTGISLDKVTLGLRFERPSSVRRRHS
jgi:hypothetical protein